MSQGRWFRHFEFCCDEPPYIGGDDEYPQPLTYVAAGVGFCVLTQFQRVASMLRKEFTRAEYRCEFDTRQEGSARAGTREAAVSEFRVHSIRRSHRRTSQMCYDLPNYRCFAEALVHLPVPIVSRYTVNGDAFDVHVSD